jgi:Gram-negative bacterial TonB protein C-terminal
MRALLLSLFALTLSAAETTPANVAELVHQKDEAGLAASLTAALQSADPLVRATTSRVIAVRGLAQLLPRVREAVAVEKDGTAAREHLRALALLGTDEDLALAVKSSAQWPEGMDNAVAIAAARRGAMAASNAYTALLHKTRMNNHAEFFRVAMWGNAAAIPITGSRLIGAGDETGWRGILSALAESDAAMSAGVIAASLGSQSEDIRSASVWFLVRGYAVDPKAIGDAVQTELAKATEVSSHREDFGREILRRMLGGEKKNDPRWLKFLESTDADELFQANDPALQFLTDEEYAVRYNRCEIQSKACDMPKKRGPFAIPSTAVAPPAFTLPDVLPAGLADAIVNDAKCRSQWLGVATATVDQAGRVQSLDLDDVYTNGACRRAIDTLLRLSLATNTSLRSGFTGPVLLVHAARNPLCLDEEPPRQGRSGTYRTGGDVQVPVAIKRVEPNFPQSALKKIPSGYSALVIVESIITKEGCVRGLRVVEQSPFPEINGAALLALSQFKFRPGHIGGEPVDVIFHLSANFKVTR